MKKFSAILNDGSYINVSADRMEANENMLHVYDGTILVALVEITAIISAKITESRGCE